MVRLPGGQTRTASVRLLYPKKARQLYAYLHYSAENKNVTRYIGEATADTREEALRIAWRLAHKKGLLQPKS